MTAKVSPDTLAAAVVDSVLHNAFPDSDELAQAELSPALPTIQLAIQASRAEITVRLVHGTIYGDKVKFINIGNVSRIQL